MLYREFGRTGERLSILGFGAMRLPVIGGDTSNIDESRAIEMIRYSIDNGGNYLDTAYTYHGGNSEILCAKTLKDGYRDKVKLADKLPSWEINTYAEMERILNDQLNRLEVENIDFYLLHSLRQTSWKILKELDYQSFFHQAKKFGKIHYAGFSFHANLELFKEIVDDYDWDFCMIQLNYLDTDYQAGLEGLHYATAKGLGVIIMEPLKGGLLARRELPSELQAIWDQADIKRTPAEWGFRYLWDFPEIGLILSGMSTKDQVNENLRYASSGQAHSLSPKEKEIINQAKEFYKTKIAINCTNCRYCMPCPEGVNITELFSAYNHESMFADFNRAKFLITEWLKESERASQCTECGECEERCPQKLPIRDTLKKIAERYESQLPGKKERLC